LWKLHETLREHRLAQPFEWILLQFVLPSVAIIIELP
jgi:hypothetical protein